ncbi:Kelch-like protein 10 [Zootermopsis nevadensis]|uniref:Kelch-like protein 10 n=1 Tax=Zootermopsis nevadensis TaxID=136037 RepID=A0A067QW75_ZOONE|nr:Kelch-like protein 10 [Zootermopsis nevadensis]
MCMCVCAGGYNRILDDLSTEKYDSAEDTWTVIPGMSFNIRNFNAEVIDDTIFVIGGRCNGKTDLSVKCCKDKENRWYPVAKMNVHRNHLSTCVIKNLPNARDYAYKHRDKLMKMKSKTFLDS